jgi:AraC-like DNA-binding protein
MAFIAALQPNLADRELLAAAVNSHQVLWSDSWRELQRHVRRHPVSAAVMDLHAETRKDGALRVFRFTQRFPLTPLIVWGDADGRELFRLGKAGAADVIISRDADDSALVREIIDRVLSRGVWSALEARLQPIIDPDALDVIRYATDHIAEQVQVPELAQAFEVSISTLERRCERWRIPTPGRLLLWLRVLHGLRWLAEPGRSVESVGQQLGYSSGAAFRRALKATIDGAASAQRQPDLFDHAMNLFVSECVSGTTVRVTA